MRARPRPMALVFIPSLLRKLTGGLEKVAVEGRNIGELVEQLERRFPGFRDYVTQAGELKASVAVSIDGEIGTAGLLERVGESSEVHFLPALGGGSARPRTGGAAGKRI